MFLGGCALEAVSPLWRNEYKEAEEEEELTEEEKLIDNTENFNVNIRQLSTHGLGEEQLKSKFKVFCLSVGHGGLINTYFLFHACRRTRGDGGGGVSKNHVEVKGGISKNQAWHILHCTSPHLPINNDQSLKPSSLLARGASWFEMRLF